jgi:hypothetical protein
MIVNFLGVPVCLSSSAAVSRGPVQPLQRSCVCDVVGLEISERYFAQLNSIVRDRCDCADRSVVLRCSGRWLLLIVKMWRW